ncbi:MAG: 2-amino-4-hydroxy-6-hydroxymethyldihydropteridine diphosphokinase [Peptococcaceae bacterium]|jgi:dihydroneopterin aldolase/2-amino-4-hydroxy-6-hydroxymethyldihydropteridine diphosphokinase|nr:2-amino-4-hydroxy-6-hydroxymethyldihydropteridine diphosphokinase [Peptococcaceae bacterium]
MSLDRTDKIRLDGLRFYGYHGFLPAERELGQWFVVDLELTADLSLPAATDALADTINYAAVYEAVKAVMEGPPVDLIEALAGKVLTVCLGFAQVEKARVLLKKPQAPLGGPIGYAAVEMERGGRGPAQAAVEPGAEAGAETGPATAGEAVAGEAGATPVAAVGPPHTVWLSLGSNLGDRLAMLLGGVRLLQRAGLIVEDCSGIYETKPVGYAEQPDFYNLVLRCAATLTPAALLDICQKTEAVFHRRRDERWGPRTLDVDILLIDDLTIRTPRLTVPHPRLTERAFVLGPLGEINRELLTAKGWPWLKEGITLQISAADVKMILELAAVSDS